MIIGVSLYLVKDLPLGEALAAVAEAGFTQVELPSEGLARLWESDPAVIRERLASLGLVARTAHSPGAGWDNDAPDDAVRRASVDAASSIFAAAAAMGVEAVVVHPNSPGTNAFAQGDWSANFERAKESIRILADRAAQSGLKLAVENMPRRGLPRPGGRVEETLDQRYCARRRNPQGRRAHLRRPPSGH